MSKILALILFLPLLSSLQLNAIVPKYQTSIFNNNVASLEVNKNKDWNASPIIKINDGNRIYINFDYLSEELFDNRLKYKIKFCNYDWTLNTLLHENEYLDGFNEIILDDYKFSKNTTISYIHYSISFPNRDVKPKLSGNYVIEVYNENLSELLLTACFSVLDERVDIIPHISTTTLIDSKKAHQQLDIDIKYNFNIVDVRKDIKVVVRQNERIDNEVINLIPDYTLPQLIQYKNNKHLIFPAGNEYMRFDSSNKQLGGLNISNIEYIAPYYQLFLNPNKLTDALTYRYDETQQGKVIYRLRDGGTPDYEADYFLVDFSLKSDKKLMEDIFINGNFTFNNFSDKYKMNYDIQNKEYRLTLELKQGIYNYQFLKKKDSMSFENVFGNFYQTKNQYGIYVYYYNRNSQYDELIGYKEVTTK